MFRSREEKIVTKVVIKGAKRRQKKLKSNDFTNTINRYNHLILFEHEVDGKVNNVRL